METSTQEYALLRESVLVCLTGYDLIGVMDHGALDDEYSPEAEDFARRIVQSTPITPGLVATVAMLRERVCSSRGPLPGEGLDE